MLEFFAFHLPTRVVYGQGLVRDFSAELSGIPATRFFVVTDKILRKTGLVDRVIEGLKTSGAEVAGIFDDVPPNSEVQVCARCADAARASGADGLVAVGGGSVIDHRQGGEHPLHAGRRPGSPTIPARRRWASRSIP